MERDSLEQYVNIARGSPKQPLSPVNFEKSGLTQEMWNLKKFEFHNALDITMPTQESGPDKIRTMSKPELTERKNFRISQSKSHVKENSKESSQARYSGTSSSKNIVSSTWGDQNLRAFIESQGITRKPSKKGVRHLANCLEPVDIKGLTKRQIRDMKEGRKSHEHLINKYREAQSIKVNPNDNQKVSNEGHCSINTPA